MLWGTAKSSAFAFTITALADFILRTITWQHVQQVISETFCLRVGLSETVTSDLDFCTVFGIWKLVLNWVWSPFLIVQQKICLWYSVGSVFEVLFLRVLKFAKRLCTQTFKLLVCYFYVSFLFECVCEALVLWAFVRLCELHGPLPVQLRSRTWWVLAVPQSKFDGSGTGFPWIRQSHGNVGCNHARQASYWASEISTGNLLVMWESFPVFFYINVHTFWMF